MLVSFANLIAGLGLFFAGIWILSENLKRATSRRFRQWVISSTRTVTKGFFVGGIAGALTQSMPVTVFILVGLMRAGLIGIRNAIPLLSGANIGLCALVFVATLETQLVMLFVIGIVGFAIGMNLSDRIRPLIGAVFGLSMLFLGIDLIQSGAVPLLEHEWAEGMLTWARHSYLTSFLVGALLTCVSQSSAAVTILAISLADAGVFGMEQTIMIIYGTNLGSSVITALLSWNLRGQSLQIAMFQTGFNVVGCIIMIPLFYLEVHGGVPLVESLITSFTTVMDLQLAWVYLLFNVAAAIPLLLFLGPVARLLERVSPPTEIEDLSKPEFIHDTAVRDPETAIDLTVRELRRELDNLPTFLKGLERASSHAEGTLADRLSAYTMLHNRITEFIDAVNRRANGYSYSDRLKELYNDQHIITSSVATLYELARTIQAIERDSPMRPLAKSIAEKLDLILRDTIDAAHGRTHDTDGTAVTLDSTTAEALQEIRDALTSSNRKLADETRAQMFKILNLSERFSWLLSHIPVDEFARLEKA